LSSLLYPEPGESSPALAPEIRPVASFAIQYALAAVWQSCGLQPALVVGSGTGECIAACCAGVVSMEDALRRFRGRVLLILSGDDLTAQEFKDVVARSRRWRQLLSGDRVTRCDLPGANHTFARRDWRNQVERWTEAWVKNL